MTRRKPLPLARALEEHAEALLACRKCVLSPGIRPVTTATRTPIAMLVGQAPGQMEQAGGRPFAGRAGKTLFQWLAQAGLDEQTARDRLYIAAITRCYPGPHPSGRGDRVPTLGERKRCGDWLANELRIIRPPFIVPVGRLAIDRFLGPMPLDEAVGREHQVEHEGGSSVIIPLPHPSGASSWIHAPEHKALLNRSLELLRKRLVAKRVRSVA
ncbi:MAG: Uracil-DNA glycosylase superfamily [Gemmatimonadetes bacterium]|nr:Uracil-DNA glycosylase superfamily [Gemmatimonadota bacterium]